MRADARSQLDCRQLRAVAAFKIPFPRDGETRRWNGTSVRISRGSCRDIRRKIASISCLDKFCYIFLHA